MDLQSATLALGRRGTLRFKESGVQLAVASPMAMLVGPEGQTGVRPVLTGRLASGPQILKSSLPFQRPQQLKSRCPDMCFTCCLDLKSSCSSEPEPAQEQEALASRSKHWAGSQGGTQELAGEEGRGLAHHTPPPPDHAGVKSRRRAPGRPGASSAPAGAVVHVACTLEAGLARPEVAFRGPPCRHTALPSRGFTPGATPQPWAGRSRVLAHVP